MSVGIGLIVMMIFALGGAILLIRKRRKRLEAGHHRRHHGHGNHQRSVHRSPPPIDAGMPPFAIYHSGQYPTQNGGMVMENATCDISAASPPPYMEKVCFPILC